jgi:hypothetical protein
MNAIQSLTLPSTTLLALREYLEFSDSKLSIEQAVVLAIREWQANSAAQANGAGADVLRGYQWKSVFLPDSTQLRMTYDGTTYYAHVVGDSIVYQGKSVSPREFTMAIAGTGRNAWRDVSLRFPGSRQWRHANLCRIELEKKRKQPAVSPVEAMTAAAASMSEALKTALKLVEQTSAQTVKQIERRLAPTRRDSDRMHDDCSFD